MRARVVLAFAGVSLYLVIAQPAPLRSEDLDAAPIHYSTAATDNRITRLQQQIDRGERTLRFDRERGGYLRDLLKVLEVPESSQSLVFSKTSLQRHRISPKTPRAVYFNDDVYVGFCLRGDVLEISAVDPQLGTVFYTLDQRPDRAIRFERNTENCLICHASSANQGFPGHLVRSVFTDRQGYPILSAGSRRTTHASPFEERWAGWYVSGTHGDMEHQGNFIVPEGRSPYRVSNQAGQNVTDLSPFFTTSHYLTPHSDIVALMVLEHQVEGHNRLARAGLLTRQALHHETVLNRELNEPADKRWPSTTRRIQAAGEPLVEYLLFSYEFPLKAPILGTTDFAKQFSQRGPADSRGRSLRQLDLNKRLFVYPCSYLIYSKAFDALPAEVREYVYRRLWDILTQNDRRPEFAYLSATDRQAILEILRDTKANLPTYWKPASAQTSAPPTAAGMP